MSERAENGKKVTDTAGIGTNGMTIDELLDEIGITPVSHGKIYCQMLKALIELNQVLEYTVETKKCRLGFDHTESMLAETQRS